MADSSHTSSGPTPDLPKISSLSDAHPPVASVTVPVPVNAVIDTQNSHTDLVVWATATRGMYESSSPLYFFLSFTSSCTLNYNLAAIRRENQTKTRNLNKIRYLTTQIKDLVVDTTVIDYNIYRI